MTDEYRTDDGKFVYNTTAIPAAITRVESAINDALIIVGQNHADLRRALLDSRGTIRESIGEGRT